MATPLEKVTSLFDDSRGVISLRLCEALSGRMSEPSGEANDGSLMLCANDERILLDDWGWCIYYFCIFLAFLSCVRFVGLLNRK